MNPSPSPNAKEFIPAPLLANHPNHAVYGDIALFGESLEDVTGVANEDIEDIAVLGLEDDDGDGEFLKKAALKIKVDQILARGASGKEIHMSITQGKYLHKFGQFKPEEGKP